MSDITTKNKNELASQPVKKIWEQAIGIIIGTAIGGIIYGIFLQALLIQSLLIDRKPVDPADWKERLTARAWICGLTIFLTLVFVPLRFLNRVDGEYALIQPSEIGVIWFLISVILIIQLATVRYATLRPDLCMVEHPTATFNYGSLPKWIVKIYRKMIPVHTRRRITKIPILRLSYNLGLWKNWVQLTIIIIEFVQLLSMTIGDGKDFNKAGINILSIESFKAIQEFKNIVWNFGMDIPTAGSPLVIQLEKYRTGFGVLSGFSSLYIFLCGVFIALDLTVDSWLAPVLFTLLAGGFYGTITSGLLLIIVYSRDSTQVIVSLLMLAYYSSTAVFVSIYRSDVKKTAVGEIRVIPVFTAVDRVSKGILAGIFVATSGISSGIRSAIILAFCCLFVMLISSVNPYSVFGITALRLTTVSIVGWTAIINIVASYDNVGDNGNLLTGLLISGWTIIPISMFVFTSLELNCRKMTVTVTTSTRPYIPLSINTVTIHSHSRKYYSESSLNRDLYNVNKVYTQTDIISDRKITSRLSIVRLSTEENKSIV